MISHPITEDAKLATEFLDTIRNPRSPWASDFATWAEVMGLDAETARVVKATVLRMRMNAAADRALRRR
jgi:hypothetical protein